MNNFTYRTSENIAHVSKEMGCTEWVDSLVDPESCLASKLWKPFNYVVFNPIYSVIILIIVYLVFTSSFYLSGWLAGLWGAGEAGCFLHVLVWGRDLCTHNELPGASKSLQRLQS